MIPKYENEKAIVQNFCNNLVEGKVSTGLLRKMNESDFYIPSAIFENVVKTCFQNSVSHQEKNLEEYKNKIILLICASQAQGSLMTIPHELVKLITVTASLHYTLMLDNPKCWDLAVDKLLNPNYKYCFSLGILSCTTNKFHFAEIGLAARNSTQEIHLYCDFLEGKISAQAYEAARYKLINR